MTTTDDIINRLRAVGRDPQTLIDLARRKGLDQNLSADMVADIAVPDRLPEDDPDFLTDKDPWSVAWDVADDILHARSERRIVDTKKYKDMTTTEQAIHRAQQLLAQPEELLNVHALRQALEQLLIAVEPADDDPR